MRKVSDKSCRENQNTHFEFSDFFLSKNRPFFLDNLEKCCRDRQAAVGNMAHLRCMLDT
jgi:hypothetical protein